MNIIAKNKNINNLRVLLVEDERWARELMVKFIEEHPSLTLASIIIDGKEALNTINSQKFDLIFLDIALPSLSGFEIIDKVDHLPYIIFTTGNEKRAVDALNIGAIDYLVKPIEKERFNLAADKAIKIIKGEEVINENKFSEDQLENQKKEHLFSELQNTYGLTYKESNICLKIYEGLSRDELLNFLKIKSVTLKFHLKSIFAKTIDGGELNPSTSHRKLPLLMTFLHKMVK